MKEIQVKHFWVRIICIYSVFWCCSSVMANVSELILSLEPEKPTYFINEPITIRMVFENKSNNVIKIPIGYPPENTRLSFMCETAVNATTQTLGINKRIPVISIRPNEAYQNVIILNRYLKFAKLGVQNVQYCAEYFTPSKPREYSFKGEFSFTIIEGAIGRTDIDSVATRIDSKDRQTRLEAIEYLLWVKNPTVIKHLERAVVKEPNYGPDIVMALGRLLPDANARKAMFIVAAKGGERRVQAFFKVCDEKGIPVLEDEYRTLLSSGQGVRYSTLEHLVKTKDPKHIPLVKLVAEDENPQIRKMATNYLKQAQ